MYLSYKTYCGLHSIPKGTTTTFLYTQQQVHQILQEIDPDLHFLPHYVSRVFQPGQQFTLRNGITGTIVQVHRDFSITYELTGFPGTATASLADFKKYLQP